MTGAGDAARLWADRSFLRDVQYKTDVNLAARQSIYAYQEPPIDLAREILSLAGPSGHEVVADIGCGNGPYLAELARRGHAGPVVGADLSPGMLHAAKGRAPEAALLVADATALPFPDGTADLTLAMHMLYHVPEPERAVRELRRITRPGGQVIVALNGEDHLRELRDLVAAALASLGWEPSSLLRERISLDQGEALLRSQFTSVTRHDFAGQLRVPDPEPVAAYVRSMRETARLPDARPLVEAVTSRLRAAPDAVFRITTRSGCLVCA
jgi:SAM-dependent methyltransferase